VGTDHEVTSSSRPLSSHSHAGALLQVYTDSAKSSEVASAPAPDAFDGEIHLGNLDRFGLETYERIWDVICKRYSYSRQHTSINLYGAEVSAQTDIIRSLCKAQHQVADGTQEAVVKSLNDLTDFLNSGHGDVVHLLGPHGCGKSTLLARFVVEKEVVDISEAFMEERDAVKSLKTYIREVIKLFRPTKTRKFGGEAPNIAHDSLSKSAWDRIKEVIGVALLSRAKDESSDELDAFLTRFETKIHGEHDDLHSGTGIDDKDIDALVSQVDAPTKIDKAILHNVFEQIHLLVQRRVPAAEISFRAHHARCVLFFKRPSHTTNHMISHLCSSVLEKQDAQAPSWRRFELLLRQTTEPPELSNKEAAPILIVLDGINQEERSEIRRIVRSFQGRVRAIISIDPTALQDDDQSTFHGLRKFTTTVTVPPLAYTERKLVFSHLIDRVGPKKRPENLGMVTSRPNAGSPLYLNTVAAYLSACIVLNSQPESLGLIANNTAEIISHQFLPMVERNMGEEVVRNFVAVLNHDPLGHERKEIRAMLHGCDVDLPEDRLRVLMEAFRPFADTQSTMSEDHIVITRRCMHDACQLRYAQASAAPSEDFCSELDALKAQAATQDKRIARMSGSFSMRAPVDHAHEESDHNCEDDGGEWFSDEEDMAWTKTDVHSSKILDELDMAFGSVLIHVDRTLFFSWCVGQHGLGSGERDSTMDLNELFKMLKMKRILPTHVSKTQASEAFKMANLNHSSSLSTDRNHHELDFPEFLDCMQRLHAAYR